MHVKIHRYILDVVVTWRRYAKLGYTKKHINVDKMITLKPTMPVFGEVGLGGII